MIKRKIFLAKKGEGKTSWILNNMQDEAAAGKTLYYIGDKRDCDTLNNKLRSLGCGASVNLVGKDVVPTGDVAVFTDDLLFSMWYIWPLSVRALKNLTGTWYITMGAENFCNIGFEE